MVNLILVDNPPEEFFEMMPFQEAVAQQYLTEGKLINYALSMEQGKLWAVFKANSELEVLEMLIDFPLTEFMEIEITLLSNYLTPGNPIPEFSLN